MDFLPLASTGYFWLLTLLLIARGADFLSTWIGTPTLALEANPLAKKLGWRWGLILNIALCLALACWPLPAIVLATTSMLVASRNLQSAWLMRSLGEIQYRTWIANQLSQTSLGLYLSCVTGQTLLTAAVGLALVRFSRWDLIPFAIGVGIITYALAVACFTLLAVWRLRADFR